MKIKVGLVIEQLPDGGSLILDEGQRHSHALRPEAAAVWRQLEQGNDEVAAVAEATGLDAALVESAMAEIVEAGLAATDSAGSSRREWLARAATVAGAAVGLKLVETIATPAPAAAQSLVADGAPGG